MKFAVILFINFVLSVVATALFIDAEEIKTKAYKTEAAKNVLSVVADSIENMRSKLSTLDYFVQHNGFDVDDFIAIAKTMMVVDEASKSNLQLAPKGIVTAIYPNESNPAAYINLLTDPARKEAALNAIKVNQCYSQGPMNLFQGGQGVIIRCPVFGYTNQKRVFNGFVNSLINLDEVLANIDFTHLIDSRYDYSLVVGTNNPRFIVVDQSTQTTNSFGVSASKEILGKQWEMTIYPVTSWISQQYFCFMVLCCLLYNLVALAIVCFLIRLNHHKQSSHLDYLTQTYNKKYLQEYLARLIRKRQSFYLFYIDINDFKPINDNFGHDVGDKLLIEFSQRLIKNICSKNTKLFRVGGDEFNLVMVKDDSLDLEYIIERMRYISSQEYSIDSLLIKSSISYGYAVYPEESYDITSLMKLADERMYHCKHQHKYDAQDFQI